MRGRLRRNYHRLREGLPATIALRVRILHRPSQLGDGATPLPPCSGTRRRTPTEKPWRGFIMPTQRGIAEMGGFDTAKEQVALAVDAWPEIRGHAFAMSHPAASSIHLKSWRSIAR